MFFFTPALVGFGFSLFAVLALAPLADAHFSSITFSTVKQCSNFTVDFAGGKAPSALPLTLTILPLNGTPFFIPLPGDAWNSTTETGAAITFLPFPQGTQFIASLDDAQGVGTALVSDVLVIDPSDTDDTSCLPQAVVPFTPLYSLNGSLSQCESFSINYDPAANISSPTVRAFVPKGDSFPINETEASDPSGVDTYLMDVPRDSMVVLMFSNQQGHHETSPILPVLGDVDSDTSCIPTNPLATAATLETSTQSTHVTTKITIIVIAVCVGVIGTVALVMIIWYFHHRRKLQNTRKFSKLDEAASPRDPEKQQVKPVATTPRPLSLAESGYGGYQEVIRNPPYVRMGSALITPTSPDPKDPFGERAMGSLMGSLSARESFNSKLGATAMGNVNNGSSTLALPRTRQGTPSPYPQPARRSSEFDPASEPMPGTSPYFGRLAVTPDNSLASNVNSPLRRQVLGTSVGGRSWSSGSVSSVEIDRILEMATIYDAAEVPDFPQPVMNAATLRSSAYMAGRESRRTSFAPGSPLSSPAHSRNNSASVLGHSRSHSTLRLGRTFREPPLATLPSSPLPSPVRPSFDGERNSTPSPRAGSTTPRPLPVPPPALLDRNISSSTRASIYSDDEEDLEGFTMLQPPVRRS